MEKKEKIVVDAHLEENKVLVWENREQVYEPGYFGKEIGDRLELSLVEACLLLKRGRIRVLKDGKKISFKKLYEHACSLDKRFPEKFRVYEDLRDRGLLVRTGYKFGCDFRVYERGSFQELSRAVRLAHNIRARMLWAIVDNEGDCTYLQVTRHKP